LTPRELFEEFEAIRLRRRDEFERDVSLAWHVEAFRRAPRDRKLPALAQLLRTGPQSPAEMRQQLIGLAQTSGFKLRIVGGTDARPAPARRKAKATRAKGTKRG
jgi:hypothetical protein